MPLSTIVKVRPAEGARVRQPNRNFRVMPAEGDLVDTSDSFYNRLITSGDLVVVKEEVAAKQKAKPLNPPPDKDTLMS